MGTPTVPLVLFLMSSLICLKRGGCPKMATYFQIRWAVIYPNNGFGAYPFLETNHLGFDDSLLPMPVKRLGRSLTGHWRTSSSPDGLILGYWIPTGFHDIHSFSSDCAGFPSWDAKIGQKDSNDYFEGYCKLYIYYIFILWNFTTCGGQTLDM